MQAVVATAAGDLAERGIDPPLLRSGNVDGGHEWNGRVIERVRATGSSPALTRAAAAPGGGNGPGPRPAATVSAPARRPARSRAAAIRAATSSA